MDQRVLHLLRKLGLEAHAEAFEANDVDLEALGYLDDGDLKELALSRAEALGMATLAAQCHQALGCLLSEGAAEEAKRHLTRSREMFEGLGLSEPDSPPR